MLKFGRQVVQRLWIIYIIVRSSSPCLTARAGKKSWDFVAMLYLWTSTFLSGLKVNDVAYTVCLQGEHSILYYNFNVAISDVQVPLGYSEIAEGPYMYTVVTWSIKNVPLLFLR